MGITPLNGWMDEGNANGNADSMFLASGSYVWLGIGSSIYITEPSFTTVHQTISLGGGATIRANCFHEYGGYMYIGGVFDSVNGNATQQYGLTRISLSGGIGSYVIDPMWDSAANIYGVASGQEVYAIHEYTGVLYVGGAFTQFSNGSIIGYGFQVLNAIAVYGSYVFWGGAFTTTQNGFFSANYIAAWGGGWNQIAGNNFNGSVTAIIPSQTLGNYMLVGGSFNQLVPPVSGTPLSNLCYIDASNLGNQETPPNISPSQINRGGLYGVSGIELVASNSGDNYRTDGALIWISLGQSNLGLPPSGCFYYNSQAYNSYYSYSYVRRTFTQSQVVTFTGYGGPNSFLYNGTNYTNFVMNTRYTAQSFIANSNGVYWVPIGSLCIGGSFT